MQKVLYSIIDWFIPAGMLGSDSDRLMARTCVLLQSGLSLSGAGWVGGRSSPLLPWFLIAMVLGFFYLAESIKLVLSGIAMQLAIFVVMRFVYGHFPSLLAAEDLQWANTFSILAA